MARFWNPWTENPCLVDDEEGGVLFYNASRSSSSGYGHVSVDKQRQRLPVYRYRTAILYLLEKHATTIIVGETGSGKTTQIPQTVAYRVAEEMSVKLGEEVGHTIRFEDITNNDLTRIKSLTDGVLLRKMMDDPLLSKYRYRCYN